MQVISFLILDPKNSGFFEDLARKYLLSPNTSCVSKNYPLGTYIAIIIGDLDNMDIVKQVVLVVHS